MRNYITKAINLRKSTMTKNMLLKLKNARVGFKEVEQIAEHIAWQYKSSTKFKDDKFDIVKVLMKHKMNDALNCVTESRAELNKSKNSLDNIVRKGTVVGEEFVELVNREINIIWKNGKDKNQEKVEWAVHKQKEKEEENEIIGGVIVGDGELEKYEERT